MAFTRAPVNDTHNVVRIEPSGTAFLTSNESDDPVPISLNYIDCFPLTEPNWQGKETVGLHKREAWESATCSGSVTTLGVLGRMLVMAPDVGTYQNVFFAKHSVYYAMNYDTKAVSTVTTSTVTAAAQYASAAVAVDSTNAKRICFLDGASELKTWLQDGTSVTTTDLSGIGVDGLRGLVFLNSYLFAVSGTNNGIYNSTVGGNLTTWASTDFIAAEEFPDPVVWIDKHKNFLVAFGTQSIEFFYDGGIEVGSPLVRQESYARQIGLYTTGALPGKYTARIDDDIYFLGTKENDSVGLFRLRNFQIEEITTQYAQGILNLVTADPKVDIAGGLETIIVNNNPMIMINLQDQNYNLMYFPKEEAWWQMSQTNDPTGADFPEVQYRLGTQFFSVNRGFPIWLSQMATSASSVYYNVPDFNASKLSTAVFYTPVIDFGINYWKHVARADVVGDFGVNDISLGFNPTPVYEQSYQSCLPTRNQYTQGYGTNLSWYNLGPARQMIFRVQMTGYGPAIYRGLDIEYNAGAA